MIWSLESHTNVSSLHCQFRETAGSLTLVTSNAKRPPGTSYSVIQMGGDTMSGDEAAGGDPYGSALGMTLEMNRGLVQLTKVDKCSPVIPSSLEVGDFILAINGVVTSSVESALLSLSEAYSEMLPILYFDVGLIRVSLVNKVLDDSYKKQWSPKYDECLVLPPLGNSNPLTIRFNESGTCALIDPLRAFKVKKFGRQESSDDDGSSLLSDHPLNAVVEILNRGIACVMDAIRQGVAHQG